MDLHSARGQDEPAWRARRHADREVQVAAIALQDVVNAEAGGSRGAERAKPMARICRKGRLTGATTIQRINTKGGMAEGPCENSGAFLSVPYSADYTFLTKGG